jgi:hypothetical protein
MGGDWVDLADQKACAKIIGAKPITAAEASSPARAMGRSPRSCLPVRCERDCSQFQVIEQENHLPVGLR